MPYRLVIFDFDGTLADSAAWLFSVLNQVAERYGFRQVSESEIAMLRGQDNRAIIRYLGVPTWKLPFIARHMRRLSAEDATAIRLFEGVPALLQSLADQGVILAVVSSNAETTVRRVLGPDCAALIRHYDCGAGLFGKAARFRRLLRRTGIPPAAAIAIGDEARDIEAARRAGIAAGAVTWGYAAAEFLESLRPTLTLRSVAEIPAALAGMGASTGNAGPDREWA